MLSKFANQWNQSTRTTLYSEYRPESMAMRSSFQYTRRNFSPQALLHENDPNGGLAEASAAEVRHMQSEDPASEADPHSAGCK